MSSVCISSHFPFHCFYHLPAMHYLARCSHRALLLKAGPRIGVNGGITWTPVGTTESQAIPQTHRVILTITPDDLYFHPFGFEKGQHCLQLRWTRSVRVCLASNGYFETLNVGETIPANFTKHFPEESEHDAAWKTDSKISKWEIPLRALCGHSAWLLGRDLHRGFSEGGEIVLIKYFAGRTFESAAELSALLLIRAWSGRKRRTSLWRAKASSPNEVALFIQHTQYTPLQRCWNPERSNYTESHLILLWWFLILFLKVLVTGHRALSSNSDSWRGFSSTERWSLFCKGWHLYSWMEWCLLWYRSSRNVYRLQPMPTCVTVLFVELESQLAPAECCVGNEPAVPWGVPSLALVLCEQDDLPTWKAGPGPLQCSFQWCGRLPHPVISDLR